jgi:hypothetical protein
MVAEAKHRINRLMDSGVISPTPAYAVNLNSPPQPMAGFGSDFTTEGGGGGCFVDIVSGKRHGSALPTGRLFVDGLRPWLGGAAGFGLMVGVFALSVRRRR